LARGIDGAIDVSSVALRHGCGRVFGCGMNDRRASAAELDRSYPGAAGSLREGLEETAHAHPARHQRQPEAHIASTNPCESMIEIVRHTQRNVKRWSPGEMALRWTAAGMLEAERQFRKIIGYRDLATLVVAIEREHDRRHAEGRTPTQEPSILVTT
jgi:putative transposase